MTPEIKKRIDQIRHGEVPEGYRKTLWGIVPTSWAKSSVGRICSITSGNTPRRNNPDSFKGSILWVTSGELKAKYLIDTFEKITEDAAKSSNLYMYEPGTVVIALYGLEAAGVRGTASIIGRKCTISQACMAFTRFSNVLNEYFYYWYVNNGQVIGLRYAQGTKQQNLSTEIVKALPVDFPDIEEQEKIIEILSLQDKIIELKEKRLAEKQQQKKYLMQQLLTGEKRISGFSNAWRQMMFSDAFTFMPTNTLSRENLCDDHGSALNIHYGDILIKYSEVLRVDATHIPYIKKTVEIPVSAYVKDGDLIIADTAEDYTVGKAVEIRNLGEMKVVSGLHTILCRPMKGIFAPGWLGYYINSPAYHNQLISLICGVKVCSISKREIKKTVLIVPEMKEQMAIVDIFAEIDRELNLLKQDIIQERQKKKALMQLLLTGIVRVNI